MTLFANLNLESHIFIRSLNNDFLVFSLFLFKFFGSIVVVVMAKSHMAFSIISIFRIFRFPKIFFHDSILTFSSKILIQFMKEKKYLLKEMPNIIK